MKQHLKYYKWIYAYYVSQIAWVFVEPFYILVGWFFGLALLSDKIKESKKLKAQRQFAEEMAKSKASHQYISKK